MLQSHVNQIGYSNLLRLDKDDSYNKTDNAAETVAVCLVHGSHHPVLFADRDDDVLLAKTEVVPSTRPQFIGELLDFLKRALTARH